MTPCEIMLSESQERMLVVKKGREAEVEAIFDKWISTPRTSATS